MKKRLIGRLILGLALPVLLLGVWWYLANISESLVFPKITSVILALINGYKQPEGLDAPSLLFSTQLSLLRTILGFALAVVFAVPIGISLGRCRILRWLLSPLLNVLYVISPLAWLPLLIALVGIDSLADLLYGRSMAWEYGLLDNVTPAMLIIIATAAFFPIVLTCERAARTVKRDLIETIKLAGGNGLDIWRLVIIPYSFPEIINGMRIALGRAWMVIVAAEMYPGTRGGLGYTIWVSHETLQYEYTFAAIIIIGFLGVLMNGILSIIHQHISFWQGERI